MRVITVVNNKGGVAKTITSVNLACSIASKGFKTLLVDLDQQANATLNLGCTGEGTKNIADVFFEGSKLNESFMPTDYENLYLVPSGSAFINGEQRLIGDVMKGSVERRLKVVMKDLDFDYVIIDCPPSLSTLITNALYISTDIIIPCAIDGFSLEGLSVIYNKIINAKQDYAEKIQRVGVLWTRVDTRQILTKQLMAHGENINIPIFDTKIRESVKVRESTVQRVPLVVYNQACNPALDYLEFANEVLNMVE
jgi:chromosome partitioning protein